MKQKNRNIVEWPFKEMKLSLIILILVFIGCTLPKGANCQLAKSVQIVTAESGIVVQNIIALMTSRIKERCGAVINHKLSGDLKIELGLDTHLPTETYKIDQRDNGVIRITGADNRGILYGVGKFLRTSKYTNQGLFPSNWEGTSTPEKPIRGIYFATHFYNYYQTAPVEELQKYIEDLGLWGVNSIMFWFDMHHFNGINDPEAIAMLNRLKKCMETLKKLDLKIAITLIGNEGYNNSPEQLRAVPGASRGGDYTCVICPDKPGGMEYILSNMGQYFDEIQMYKPDYVCIWPYDQGGCASAGCQPWGGKGFIKCAKSISQLARKKLPEAKIILSTWYFDKPDWIGLKEQLLKDDSWIDIMLAEKPETGFDVTSEIPAMKIPMIGFPEISMQGTFPWGGFGATPLPEIVRIQWDKTKANSQGGFPYSEGIYEDISKVVSTQLQWGGKISVDSILAEYVAYEFSTTAVNDIVKVIATLEQNHHFRWWPGKLEGVKLQLDWFPSKNTPRQEDPGAEEAYDIVKQINPTLSRRAATSWRWRILYIRTMLDAELKKNEGSPTEKSIKGFKELMKIYHTSEKTDPAVKPPLTGKR